MNEPVGGGVSCEEAFQLEIQEEGEIVLGEVLPPQIEVDGNMLTGVGSFSRTVKL